MMHHEDVSWEQPDYSRARPATRANHRRPPPSPSTTPPPLAPSPTGDDQDSQAQQRGGAPPPGSSQQQQQQQEPSGGETRQHPPIVGRLASSTYRRPQQSHRRHDRRASTPAGTASRRSSTLAQELPLMPTAEEIMMGSSAVLVPGFGRVNVQGNIFLEMDQYDFHDQIRKGRELEALSSSEWDEVTSVKSVGSMRSSGGGHEKPLPHLHSSVSLATSFRSSSAASRAVSASHSLGGGRFLAYFNKGPVPSVVDPLFSDSAYGLGSCGLGGNESRRNDNTRARENLSRWKQRKHEEDIREGAREERKRQAAKVRYTTMQLSAFSRATVYEARERVIKKVHAKRKADEEELKRLNGKIIKEQQMRARVIRAEKRKQRQEDQECAVVRAEQAAVMAAMNNEEHGIHRVLLEERKSDERLAQEQKAARQQQTNREAKIHLEKEKNDFLAGRKLSVSKQRAALQKQLAESYQLSEQNVKLQNQFNVIERNRSRSSIYRARDKDYTQRMQVGKKVRGEQRKNEGLCEKRRQDALGQNASRRKELYVSPEQRRQQRELLRSPRRRRGEGDSSEEEESNEEEIQFTVGANIGRTRDSATPGGRRNLAPSPILPADTSAVSLY